MASYAALLSLKFIINQIQQHPRPPISLDQQHLHSLTANISFLQNFLEGYPSSDTKEEDELESRIADAAYAAEDVIESHIVNQIHARSTCHGENISCVDFYQGLERVIQDMDLIEEEVMQIIKEKKMEAQHHQLISTNSSVSIGPVRPVSMMQNNTMVDFGDILIDVMDKLTRQEYNLEIVPIVGMGGSGKSTLAKSIYAHPLIVQHFDILVWVTISQEYSVHEILLRILSMENDKGQMFEDHELGERVHKKLYGRRYLIVMDDIWSIEAWYKVKAYFPNNGEGSKIMITTRLLNLAFQLSGSHDFQIKLLDESKSWDLLCNVVFGKQSCPIELEDIGKMIARNCRGLPLSIVVIGGLLKKSNMTQEYWEYSLINLNSQINLESNENCLQILGKSYRELPIHLKPCFLYMGVFPEDYEIHVSELIKLLVVEGILKPIENKSLEEVAEEYVKELIERNLIMVHELCWNRKTKSCKIHDLLRDLCLREARKQRFLCILRRQDLKIPDDINMERRICIHDINGDEMSPQFIHAIESEPLIRSLIVFGSGFSKLPPLIRSLIVFGCGSSKHSTCRLLRVLSCFGYHSESWTWSSHGDIDFQQANLRYLSLGYYKDEHMFSNSYYKEEHMFPNSWYLLWNIQTLDVAVYGSSRSTNVIAASEIWKMSHLRHVKFHRLQLPNPPFGEDELVLENLHTLSGILNFKCSEEVVKRIPNIKNLKLLYSNYGQVEEETWLRHFSLNNLGHLRNLESLYLDFGHAEYFPDPETMQNLSLPHSLKMLSLFETFLLWEDLNTKIGSLPLLEVLNLEYKSCVGPEWETIEGKFCNLKFLQIKNCRYLRRWTTEDSHFPRLESLVLRRLRNLKEIPLSIGDIPTLRLIDLEGCLEFVKASVERIKEEQVNNGNEDLQVVFGYCYHDEEKEGELVRCETVRRIY